MRKRGFTLIELLVVVLIIGVLTAIAVPQYQVAVTTSKTAPILSFVRTLDQAEARYKLATGAYTTDFRELDISMPESGTMTEDGTSISYSKFTCGFHGQFSTYQSYICTLKGNINIIFEKYIEKQLICWAGDDPTEIKNKVCQKLAGTTTPATVHSTLQNGYIVFYK